MLVVCSKLRKGAIEWSIHWTGGEVSRRTDLHVGTGDDMADHPGGMLVYGVLMTFQEGYPESVEGAAEEIEGRPPVRGSVLVMVAVGEGGEDRDEGGEGGVVLGEGVRDGFCFHGRIVMAGCTYRRGAVPEPRR